MMAFIDGLRLRQSFLNIDTMIFLPSQSANRTSWKANGEFVTCSVSTSNTSVHVAINGPFKCRNSSLDGPSFWWCITWNQNFKYEVKSWRRDVIFDIDIFSLTWIFFESSLILLPFISKLWQSSFLLWLILFLIPAFMYIF